MTEDKTPNSRDATRHASALRYVILRHEGIPDPHYDLMFETAPGSLLRTWRSPVWSIDQPTKLTPLGDHRRDYLDYQGPVSGNRGAVRQIEAGTFKLLKVDETQFLIELNQARLSIQRTGETWVITKIRK